MNIDRADELGPDARQMHADHSIGSELLSCRKLTVPQAAKRLGIGDTKMREVVRTGAVPVVRIMGKVLILERDLENYLQGNYGRLRRAESKPNDRLPPLPQHVRDSSLLRKAN